MFDASKSASSKNNIDGFSLLELIIVIVLIGIIAISFSRLTVNSMRSYIDGKDRNQLSQSAKWVTEKLSREIREALPQSVRTGNSGGQHCVEFMGISNASTYLNIAASGSVTTFNAVAYNLLTSTATILAIMPINTSAIYAASGVLANIQSIAADPGDPNQVIITLTAATSFARRSPNNRFYLLNTPVAFCLNDNNGKLTRYSNYPRTALQQFPPTGTSIVASLLADNLSANGFVFRYQANTLSRAGLLQINLRAQNRSRGLIGGDESFEVFHEVHIRNVP